MKLVKLGLVCGALLVSACSGEDGVQGAQGEQGPAGPAGSSGDGGGNGAESINGITPARAFVGRTVEVSLSGDNTNWTEAAKPTVNFGAGVTVNSVVVASPTALVMNVTIGNDAAAGPRDITVGEQTYKGFQVVEPVSAAITGDAAQGSIFLVDVANADRENPFDASDDGANFAAGIFDGNAPAEGVFAQVSALTDRKATLVVFADVNATAGALDVVTLSGSDEATAVSSVAKGAANVAARTAAVLPAGTTPLTLPAGNLVSQLFSFEVAAAGPTSISFVPAAGGDAASVALRILPESGKWEEELQAPFNFTAGQKLFVVALGGASTATTGNIVTRTLAGTAFSETEPNETIAQANALTLPVNISAEIVARGTEEAPVSDVDSFSFAATAGTTYYVDQLGRNASTLDAIVTLVGPDGEVIEEFDNPDGGTTESFSFTAATAGTYVVQVEGYASPFTGVSTGLYTMYVAAAQ